MRTCRSVTVAPIPAPVSTNRAASPCSKVARASFCSFRCPSSRAAFSAGVRPASSAAVSGGYSCGGRTAMQAHSATASRPTPNRPSNHQWTPLDAGSFLGVSIDLDCSKDEHSPLDVRILCDQRSLGADQAQQPHEIVWAPRDPCPGQARNQRVHPTPCWLSRIAPRRRAPKHLGSASWPHGTPRVAARAATSLDGLAPAGRTTWTEPASACVS
jgi:hypothetical protein